MGANNWQNICCLQTQAPILMLSKISKQPDSISIFIKLRASGLSPLTQMSQGYMGLMVKDMSHKKFKEEYAKKPLSLLFDKMREK